MRLDHVHVACCDRDAMAAWLGRVLRLAPAKAFAAWARDGGPLFLRTPGGPNALALFEASDRGGAEGDHTIAFAADAPAFLDLWRRADALGLRERSGRALSEAGPQDHDGLAFSLYFVGPEGHRFEVTCYEVAAVRAGLAA